MILTLDEEANLPKALGCLGWCDDIVVVDSGSKDRTVEIAHAAGARVVFHPFTDWASQGNWALTNVTYKHPWVYYMDADEWLPEDLVKEILEVTRQDDPAVAAYRVRYKNFFLGRWLRRATLYPSWITRLMRPGRATYENRLVNPHPICEGELRELQAHFHHFSFNKGLTAWFEKHNRYSSAEAIETLRSRQQPMPWRNLVSSDPGRRRRALKLLSMRMPGRAVLKFVYMYFLRRGFLDGYPGFCYCMLQSMYEAMIVMKVHELRRRGQGLPI